MASTCWSIGYVNVTPGGGGNPGGGSTTTVINGATTTATGGAKGSGINPVDGNWHYGKSPGTSPAVAGWTVAGGGQQTSKGSNGNNYGGGGGGQSGGLFGGSGNTGTGAPGCAWLRHRQT
ncbi:hypothetical protein [Mycolicibacterium insubricum]|uniref:hypothetical protein n=1 Tax=Mycolicibacterium insubricum TaxID=444597 RepID=UPI0021F3483E|nr:hypothetical protein [Mycolicibacterium insubricum]MCV7081284.1 hypothetical protein [Mycolicibacterium insubricum]